MSAQLATRIAGVSAALALALTGCSSGDPAPSASSTGPLEEFFAGMYDSYDEDKANADMMRVEEIVAECMADQGFDYTPVDYSSQGGGGLMVGEELDVEWGTLEFAKKYGYGATTNPWGDPTTEEPVDEPSEWVDPNQEYVDSMSETEQQAYWTALYGDQTYTEPEEGEEIEYDWTTAGCQGKAQHEVYEVDQPWADDKFTDLMDEMNGMYEAIQNDPKLTELAADWSSCMADAGYPGFAAVEDAETSIYDKVNAIWEHAYDDLGDDATEEDWAAIDEQVQSELSTITDDEIATATADYTCRDEVKYTKTQQDIQFEHEQAFIDAHRAELEEWKAAYSDAQG